MQKPPKNSTITQRSICYYVQLVAFQILPAGSRQFSFYTRHSKQTVGERNWGRAAISEDSEKGNRKVGPTSRQYQMINSEWKQIKMILYQRYWAAGWCGWTETWRGGCDKSDGGISHQIFTGWRCFSIRGWCYTTAPGSHLERLTYEIYFTTVSFQSIT